jgi:hypothetical protein
VNALTGTNATITEYTCVVQQDPRKICGAPLPTRANPNPYYSYTELPVSALATPTRCTNATGDILMTLAASTLKIPDYICGDYGPGGEGTGTGFVLLKGTATGVDAIPGLLFNNDATPEPFFGRLLTPPTCPPTATGGATLAVPNVFAWAPLDLPFEGRLPEGSVLIDLPYGCGGSQGYSDGLSLSLLGGKLNFAYAKELGPPPHNDPVANLVNFSYYKYGNLAADVVVGNIALPQKTRLLELIGESALLLSKGTAYYDCAANKLLSADKYVADHASSFLGAPQDRNTYGRSRSRIANLFFTEYSRLAQHPPLSFVPSAPAPGTSCPINITDADGY